MLKSQYPATWLAVCFLSAEKKTRRYEKVILFTTNVVHFIDRRLSFKKENGYPATSQVGGCARRAADDPDSDELHGTIIK